MSGSTKLSIVFDYRHITYLEENKHDEHEATPDKEESEEDDSVPSIGVFATLLGFLAASAFVRRKQEC